MLKVAVAGCTGYAGGELLRLLLAHPNVEIGALSAGTNAGSLLGAHQPHLAPLAQRRIEPTTADVLAGHDVVFFALPHGASAPIAQQLDPATLVVDCGADFRLASEEAWTSYYKSPWAGQWPYGLPELPGQREKLATTKRIAVPGCYPTSATLALLPAVAADLVFCDDIVIVAASGVSGAGKSLKPNLLGSELMGSTSAYGVGGVHRHIPEIAQNLALVGSTNPVVSFTPMLVPMSRGILATASAKLRPGVTNEDVRQAYQSAYADEPFVSVTSPGILPNTAAVLGSNAALVHACADSNANRLIALCAIDNLTKGTAGGAIQSMNIACGFDETTGLSTIGVAP